MSMAKVEGLDRLRAKFRALPPEVQAAMQKAMETIAEEWVAMMRRLAPRDEGKVAASIGWTWGAPPIGSLSVGAVTGEKGMRITIYAGDQTTIVTNSRGIAFQNAKLQEFGTKSMPASPFFFPVVRARGKNAKSRITSAASRAAKKLWAK